MLARTWPYGTRKAVTVGEAGMHKGAPFAICVEECQGGEGFILLGMKEAVQKGEKGYIEFKQGGPTGGYWEFHKGSLLITPS